MTRKHKAPYTGTRSTHMKRHPNPQLAPLHALNFIPKPQTKAQGPETPSNLITVYELSYYALAKLPDKSEKLTPLGVISAGTIEELPRLLRVREERFYSPCLLVLELRKASREPLNYDERFLFEVLFSDERYLLSGVKKGVKDIKPKGEEHDN